MFIKNLHWDYYISFFKVIRILRVLTHFFCSNFLFIKGNYHEGSGSEMQLQEKLLLNNYLTHLFDFFSVIKENHKKI